MAKRLVARMIPIIAAARRWTPAPFRVAGMEGDRGRFAGKRAVTMRGVTGPRALPTMQEMSRARSFAAFAVWRPRALFSGSRCQSTFDGADAPRLWRRRHAFRGKDLSATTGETCGNWWHPGPKELPTNGTGSNARERDSRAPALTPEQCVGFPAMRRYS